MDYAILKTGGKQYRVKPGDVIDVERLSVEEGSPVELSDVLAVSRDGEVILGTPIVPDASVLAQVKAHGKDKKIIIFKYKRKIRYRRKNGHRQLYTRLAITGIMLGGEEVGVQDRPEHEVSIQEEPTAEEVSAELEDEAADEPGDEPTDQLDDEPSSELGDEPTDEQEDEVVSEAPLEEVPDESENEVQGGSER